jgi:hypothetical protein
MKKNVLYSKNRIGDETQTWLAVESTAHLKIRQLIRKGHCEFTDVESLIF